MVEDKYRDDAERIERDYVSPNGALTADEIEDALEENDFADAAIDDISDWIATPDDVMDELGEPHSNGVTTREDVERATESANRDKAAEARAPDLSDHVSRDVGAPDSDELRRAQLSTFDDTTTPDDVLGEGAGKQSVSIVRNQSGDPVATVGGGSGGRQVADELGATHYTNPQEYNDDMTVDPAPDGREGLLRLRGEAVGEVDL